MSRAKTDKKVPQVRCAIYTRKSTEEGLEQEFNSLDAQREAAEAYIASLKAEGWVCLPEMYDDGGFSGGNMDRPALRRLMADIEAGKVDCVVVYKVDRLSRSLLDFARIIGTFDERKVAFVSVTQQFNTSAPMGRLVLNVLLSFAQFEREIIGERIRDKIAAQRRKGKWTGGYPILGYDVDRSSGSPKLVINSEEAIKVRAIFNLYLRLGSLLSVAEEVEKRGWATKPRITKGPRSRGSRPFDKGNLWHLLTNPIYIGKIKHKNELYDGEHASIVAVDVFNKVQSQLRRNGRSGGIEVRNRYGALLKRLLICKGCGRTMVHNFSGRNKKKYYRYYTCTFAIKRGFKQCPQPSLPAVEVERVVVDQLRGLATDKQLRAEVLRQAQAFVASQVAELDAQRRDVERELNSHQAEIRRLATDGTMAATTTGRIAALHDRVANAEARLVVLRNEREEVQREQLAEQDIVAAFTDFDRIWNELTPFEQAKVVALLVARVEFDAADSSIAVTFHPSGIKSLALGNLVEAA